MTKHCKNCNGTGRVAGGWDWWGRDALKATCEDYRIQACRPDDCNVKKRLDAMTARAEAAENQIKTLMCPECAMLALERERVKHWQSAQAEALNERNRLGVELEGMKCRASKAETKLAVALNCMDTIRQWSGDCSDGDPALFVDEAKAKIDAIERGAV